MSVEWEGIDELAAKLNVDPRRLLGDALYQEAEFNIMPKAKEGTPVDLSRLRASGHVKFPKNAGRHKVKVVLAFGTKYAIWVHEGTRPHRPPIKAVEPWAKRHGIPAGAVVGSIAKKGTKGNQFLRKPMKEAQSGFNHRIARRMKGMFNA